MAENVFTQRFYNIVKKQICTSSEDLNFDNYTAAGTYEIHESLGNGLSRVYFLTVDKSAGGHCTQTRTYCGKVEYRNCTASGAWTEWESRTGGGGSGGSGEDGGYYIPSLEQIDDNTAQMTFTPSKGDMPAIPNSIIELPSGSGGSANIITLNYGDRINAEEIYNAYTNGAVILLRGSHNFDYIDGGMITTVTAEYVLHLTSVSYDSSIGQPFLTFTGSDNYGNGVNVDYWLDWHLQIMNNLTYAQSYIEEVILGGAW